MENPFVPIYKRVSNITRDKGPVPDFPLLIDIEVTSKCNLKCIMCEHTYMKRKQEMMSWEYFTLLKLKNFIGVKIESLLNYFMAY